MSDINALGAGFVSPSETAIVTGGSAVYMEGIEHSPYAYNFLTPGFVAAGQSVALTSSTTSVSLEPSRMDLKYTAGDHATFGFFFEGIAWVEEQPVGTGWADDNGTWTYTDVDTAPEPDVTTLIPWDAHQWQAQVRTRYYQRLGYWWPPVRPFGYMLTEFSVTATFVPRSTDQVPGTLVTLSGRTIYPGRHVWDLQAVGLDEQDVPQFTRPITLLQGFADVGNQVTL